MQEAMSLPSLGSQVVSQLVPIPLQVIDTLLQSPNASFRVPNL